MSSERSILIGTSGWNYPHWRGPFYPDDLPPSRWFGYYSEHFATVEINNTFYQLPEEKTFDAWSEQAPAGFRYALKANRFITHMKKLKDAQEPLDHFLERARRLGPRLGPILYQLPPHWHPNPERLAAFCAELPDDLVHAVEFREREWLTDEIYDILRQHGVGLCVHDLIKRHPRRITARPVYVRFHGAGTKYGGNYPRQQLRRWADWIDEAAQEGHDVYAYFNNDANAYAVRNAMTLREILDED